jgi:hypothetical protein
MSSARPAIPMARPDRVTSALLMLMSFDEDATLSVLDLDDMQWDALVRAATRHGVAPLLYVRLRDRYAHLAAPERVLHALKRGFVATGLENLRLYARLAVLLRGMAAASIDAIVLKGAFLGEIVYGNAALRSMGDIDILIRRRDLARAESVVRDHGFRQMNDLLRPPTPLTGHQLPSYYLDGTRVEIHWTIEDDESGFAVDGDGLWERACAVSLGSAPALALSAEDLVLHLCLHTSYSHGWLQFDSGLRPFCDIAESLRYYACRFDWDAFAQRAQAWRMRNCAWLTLWLARDLVQARVPEAVLAMLAPRHLDVAIVEAARELTLTGHYHAIARAFPVLGRSWLSKRWQHLPRAAKLRRHLLPSRAMLANADPNLDDSGFAPLRYLVHWMDLASDCARMALPGEIHALRAREQSRVALVNWLESS